MPWIDPNKQKKAQEEAIAESKALKKGNCCPVDDPCPKHAKPTPIEPSPEEAEMDASGEPDATQELDPEEKLYEDLMSKPMAELRAMCDQLGAPRRKKREDTVYELIAVMQKEEPPAECETCEGDGEYHCTCKQEETVPPLATPRPRPKLDPKFKCPEGMENHVFRVRGRESWTCPDCGKIVRGDEKLVDINGERLGMAGYCDCPDDEVSWRFVLTHELQRKLPGKGWQVHGA